MPNILTLYQLCCKAFRPNEIMEMGVIHNWDNAFDQLFADSADMIIMLIRNPDKEIVLRNPPRFNCWRRRLAYINPSLIGNRNGISSVKLGIIDIHLIGPSGEIITNYSRVLREPNKEEYMQSEEYSPSIHPQRCDHHAVPRLHPDYYGITSAFHGMHELHEKHSPIGLPIEAASFGEGEPLSNARYGFTLPSSVLDCDMKINNSYRVKEMQRLERREKWQRDKREKQAKQRRLHSGG